MIKKLILSTLIILGIIASTQAQSNSTFDFSCETVNPDDLDGNGFTLTQEALLAEVEFTVSTPPGASITVYSRDYMIVEGGEIYELSIAPQPDGRFLFTNTRYDYNIDGDVAKSYHDDFDSAWLTLLGALPPSS